MRAVWYIFEDFPTENHQTSETKEEEEEERKRKQINNETLSFLIWVDFFKIRMAQRADVYCGIMKNGDKSVRFKIAHRKTEKKTKMGQS